MLGKLMKHELRATALPMLIVCASLVGLGVLMRLLTMLIGAFEVHEAVEFLFAGLVMLLVTLAFTAAITTVVVFIAYRFYMNIYGAEGYCTLMLPVSRRSLIMTKLITGVGWLLLVYVSFALSAFVVGTDSSFGEFASIVFSIYGDAFGVLFDYLDTPAFVYAIESVVYFAVSFVDAILLIYCSISIGQLFKKHRVIGSIGVYLGLTSLASTVTTIYTMLITFGIGMLTEYSTAASELQAFIAQASIIVFIVISILMLILKYLIVKYIMTRAVNLQ